jgi:hypothetical protein
MNHAAGLIQPLAQTLPALLSGLRIGLRRVLICALAWWLWLRKGAGSRR